MDLRDECNLQDCQELKQMILDHPDYPLLIFCGEESWGGDYDYTQADDVRCQIQSLSLYNNEQWLEEDDYIETLQNDLADNEEYKDMSDEEFDDMIIKIINKTEFIKTIVIYAG